jgi:UDP-N-acetylmuramate dehydrogenase
MNPSLKFLPEVRGQYTEKAPLANATWFKVGGPADVLFMPADTEDLSQFLINRPKDLDLSILGLCSNVIIRDNGISGFVVKLGQGFTEAVIEGGLVKVGCGLPNSHLVSVLMKAGLVGLEFLSGIPGSVGGAVAMNAGCYGSEVKDYLVSVEAVNKSTGKIYQIPTKDLSLSYRHNGLTDDFIFTSASFLLKFEEDRNKIKNNIRRIAEMKLASQPTVEKTGGSTFKNPSGHKAWELIDQAGLRGFTLGGARVSEKHTNFFINSKSGSAKDLEDLGELVINKVREKFNITLEWEIKRMGRR